MKKPAVIITVLITLFMLSACDDFILADQFESASDRFAGSSGTYNPNGTDLYFSLQSTEMTSGESKTATILGGSPPYTLELQEQGVYSSGVIDLGTFTHDGYTSGKTCGEILLNVIDDAGTTASISVFVRPKKVDSLSVETHANHRHTVTWTYPLDLLPYVESFEIQRKQGSGDFVTLERVASNMPLQYNDTENINDNLKYRVRVLAADERSVFMEFFSPK